MHKFKNILNLIDARIELWLLTVFYLYFVVIVVIEVIMRYVFNSSTIIGEETARHAFIWLSWIAASYVVKKRTYIRITMFENKIPFNVKYYLSVFYNLLFILFCVLTFLYVLPIMKAQAAYGTLSRATQYAMWIPYLAVPVGYAMMTFRVIQNMVLDFGNWRQGLAPSESAAERKSIPQI